ncbi:Hypothetical protein FKW44_008162 [Caligus rogercresseyi]|uniref:Uncharacterized protein n=1 Tax=Caligus rogercresseyi TaxID=217165 RepID=A0A7T8KFP7_CALRO|nr:Hypothetical protein FKW44_008162 [Caligus rogercresseyi]
MEAKRVSAFTLLEAGWTKKAIANYLKCDLSFVYKVEKLKNEEVDFKRKPWSGHQKPTQKQPHLINVRSG